MFNTEYEATKMYEFACSNRTNFDEWYSDISQHVVTIRKKFGAENANTTVNGV